MTADALFGRVYKLQVDDLVIDKLALHFRVTKTLSKEPNTLELVVFNLNPDNRRKLEQAKNPVVQLEAGYKERSGVLFLGDVRDINSEHVKPNWETRIESGDGEKATQFDRINKSFAKGTDLSSVLQEIAKSMSDIGIGNLAQASFAAKLPGGSRNFPNGVTVSGNSAREMERLVRSAGLQWSIQDKQFQLLEAGKALTSTAAVLTPQTGLIGSPTIGSDGVLKFRSLLNSDILPGKQLAVTTKQINGRFRVERCTYEGNTAGQEWYVSGEAKELKLV